MVSAIEINLHDNTLLFLAGKTFFWRQKHFLAAKTNPFLAKKSFFANQTENEN
jgi:hypothetical protein